MNGIEHATKGSLLMTNHTVLR